MIVMFNFSLAILFYTYIGYPFLIYFASKYKIKRKFLNVNINDKSEWPTVEIIIVVRNSEKFILRKIETLASLKYPTGLINYTFVIDSSEDETTNILKTTKSLHLKIIENLEKTSKSACLNQAIKETESEILFLTDIRQELDQYCLERLVVHFNDPNVGAVSGELKLKKSNKDDFSVGVGGYWKYDKFIRYHESIVDSVPGVTGAIYALKKSYFIEIPPDTILDDVLIPMNLILKNKRVLFENKAIAYDEPSSNILAEKNRKIRTIAGNWQLIFNNPQFLSPFKNRIWFQFVSHKVLRLFSPLFLFFIFAISFLESYNSERFYMFFLFQLFMVLIVLFGVKYSFVRKFKLLNFVVSFSLLMFFNVLGFHSFITKKYLTIWK